MWIYSGMKDCSQSGFINDFFEGFASVIGFIAPSQQWGIAVKVSDDQTIILYIGSIILLVLNKPLFLSDFVADCSNYR